MKPAAGDHVIWKDERFQVVVVRPLAVALRGRDDVIVEVEIDEFQRYAEHDAGPRVSAAQLGRVAKSIAERRRGRSLPRMTGRSCRSGKRVRATASRS